MKIPDENINKMAEISKMRNIPQNDIIIEYEQYFNSKFVQNSTKFKDDAARHTHVIGYVWMNNISRPPVKPTTIIPVGVSNIIKNKTANIIALITNKDKKTTFSTIVVRESFSVLESLRIGMLYEDVKLGNQIKEGTVTYFFDNRSNFQNPKAIKQTYSDLLAKLKVKRVTVESSQHNLSKVGADGYTINTDLRIIEGTVARCNTWSNEKGSGAVYTITDMTTRPEQFTDASGEIQNVGMSVFVHPRFAIYRTGDKCDFIGSLSHQEGKIIPTMNGMNVLPIEINDEEEEEEYDPDE